MMRTATPIAATLLAALLITPALADEPRPLDLAVEADRGLAFLLTRGSTDPDQEVVFHWRGHVYASVPADPHAEPQRSFGTPLFGFEGVSVARFVPGDGPGSILALTREMSVYLDSESGEILACWPNRFTGESVTVMPVWNDPVNFGLGGTDHRIEGDQVVWTVEIPVSYPSPLPVADHPVYSASNTYQSTELFDLVVDRADLVEGGAASIPVTLTWTRIGPWLPWMQMGQRPGQLVYHVTGRKLMNGWDEVPLHLRRFVSEHGPTFEHAPTEYTEPNATTWSVFRDRLESAEYQPRCTPD
jgi:hypothetical protein